MKNKIIIVTGGASGIGLATAKKLSIDNNVIIADVRFPNEVNSIKERGGIIIRLNRDKSRIDYHISETALDDYKEWDLVIDNNSTKEDLFNTLKKIVQKYPLK